MTDEEIDAILGETFEDRRLSRNERRALRAILEDRPQAHHEQHRFRRRAFMIAQQAITTGGPPVAPLKWLEEVVKALWPDPDEDMDARSEAYFSPGEAILDRLVSSFRRASKRVDVCVFTITDNRISKALIDAHDRGVKIRVLTDNDKARDRGSDIERFARANVQVRVDRTDAHMHHKFAIFDGKRLVNGSYNWTRSAARVNHENMIFTSDLSLLARFSDEFNKRWKRAEVY